MERPEMGRLVRLDTDLVDTQAVFAIAREVARVADHMGKSGQSRVVREALDFIWEQPRLPRPLVAGKYPVSFPWSALARERHLESQGRRIKGGRGLVLEHMLPRRFAVDTLLRAAQTEIDWAQAVEMLHGWTRAAVLTSDEDKLIGKSGYSSTFRYYSKESDLWQRYEIAGIETSTFAPLAALPE